MKKLQSKLLIIFIASLFGQVSAQTAIEQPVVFSDFNSFIDPQVIILDKEEDLNLLATTSYSLLLDPIKEHDGDERTKNTRSKTSFLTPFSCPTAFYQSLGKTLTVLDPSTGIYGLVGSNTHRFNAIGYNVLDNYIYGVGRSGTLKDYLLRFGANGGIEIVTYLGTNSIAGDMDRSGNLWLLRSTEILRVQVTPPYAQTVFPLYNSPSQMPNDIVYIPSNGYDIFYALETVDGFPSLTYLYTYNLTTGYVSSKIVSGASGISLPTGSSYGAIWTDKNNNLYAGHNSSGQIFLIENYQSANPVANLLLVGESTSSNDGASCPLTDSPFCDLAIAPGGSSPTCGTNNGSIYLNSSGGTYPLVYYWNNGSNSGSGSGSNIYSLWAGSYSITLSDANGCSIVTGVTLNQPSCPEICNDGIDNDLDGWTDCDDPDCSWSECEAYLNGSWSTINNCIINVCEGDYVALSVNPGVSTVNWTGPNGFSAFGTNDIYPGNAELSDAGDYTATISYNGCTYSKTMRLNVSGNPMTCEARVNGSWSTINSCSLSVCQGEDVVLSILPNGIPTNWTGPNGFSASGVYDIYLGNADLNEAGNYTATISYSGCTYSQTINLQVNTNTVTCEARINSTWSNLASCNVEVCLGVDVALSITPDGILANWTGPNGYSATGVNEIYLGTIQSNQLGNYTASYTYNGCAGSETIQVSLASVGCIEICANGLDDDGDGFFDCDDGDCQPLAQIIPPPTACINDLISFIAADAGTGVTYNWDFGVNASPSSGSGRIPPSVTYHSCGSKRVILEASMSGACTASDTIFFLVEDVVPPVWSNVSANVLTDCNNIPPPVSPTATDLCDTDVEISYQEAIIYHPNSSWKQTSGCSLLYTASVIDYDDKGTTTNADDELSFALTVIGKNTGGGWTAAVGSTIIGGSYYETLSFGPFLSGGSILSYHVIDENDPSCTILVTIDASGL